MNTQIKILLSTFLFINICLMSGQEVKKFTYGGNGGRSNGTFTVQFFLQSDDKTYEIEKLNNTIDLNNYEKNVRFFVEIQHLKLGLNNSFSKVRNSNHGRAYYLEASRQKINIDNAYPIEKDTIKISSLTGHFGKKSDRISYSIDSVKAKKRLLFQIKTRIIDGVFGRDWKGIIISKQVMVIPKKPANKDTTIVDRNTTVIANQSNIPLHPKRYPTYTPRDRDQSDEATVEDKFWQKIEQDLIVNDIENMIRKGKVYLNNCDIGIFKECRYHEDVLFYLAHYSKDQAQMEVCNLYLETYPTGKYMNQIEKLMTKPEIPVIPIEKDMAILDYDHKFLIVNRVKGGNLPYYIGFFDEKKSKDYAVKRVRFTKQHFSIDLHSLQIPEGSYKVKVIDAKGQVFTKENNVYVSQIFRLPKSIKVTFILLLLGLIGFLYKKYIHF